MRRENKNKLKKPQTRRHRERGTVKQQERRGWRGRASPLQWIYREKDLSIVVNSVYSLWGRQMKILLSLQFDLGSPISNHGIQVNSCSVHLVDIKKEKPFFSSTLNQASDVIGKAD